MDAQTATTPELATETSPQHGALMQNSAVPRLQRKSFGSPDRVRDLGRGHMDVVDLDESAIARVTVQPGWRWSEHVAPIVGTATCQVRHFGYTTAGRLHVRLDDGTEMQISAGDAYEIPAGHDAWVEGDVPYEAVEFASARTFGATADETGERALATILMTDIVGSTAMLERIGDAGWHRLLLEHNTKLREQLQAFGGREIRTTGDGLQALFPGASRAVRCAAAMVDAASAIGVRIRAGLHTGEVALVAGELPGIAVHAAARVSALAGPGDVFVSATTRDLLDGSGLRFEDRGLHELKGLTGARGVFALVRSA